MVPMTALTIKPAVAVPEPGDAAPPLEVTDQTGAAVGWRELLRDGPLVLVFYRGHWCPFCRQQLGRLQENLPEFRRRGASLAAISVDRPQFGARLVAELGLEYPILSSVDSAAVEAFGIRNRLLGVHSGIPHPAVFIIDQHGIIRFAEVRRNFKRRISPHRILDELDRLQLVKATP